MKKSKYILVGILMLLMPVLAFGLNIDADSNDATDILYGGTNSALTDPGADRILFWDDGAALGSNVAWLTLGSGLAISTTTLNLVLLDYLGADYDTEAEFIALFAGKQAVLTNEAGLYSALSDVNNFAQTNTAEEVSGNWEIQDDVHLSFGDGDDASFAWDNADSVLEIREVGDAAIFKFDLANKTIWASPSATPEVILNDNDNPGTEKYSASIGAQYVDGADGSENNDFFVYANVGGAKTSILDFDQSDGEWDFKTYDVTTTGAITSNYTIVTPQSKTYESDDDSEAIGTDITSSVLLVTGDNDSTDETVDLQDGTIAGQILTVIAVALVDNTDDAFILDVETDSTCSGCPTSGIFTLETVGSSVTLYWTGSAWIYIGSVVGE